MSVQPAHDGRRARRRLHPGGAPHRRRSYKAAAERREEILGCALRVFASKGYPAASIADVCSEAGVARGTLYQYFGDKRALLVALADRIVDRVMSVVAAREPLSIPQGFEADEQAVVRFVETRLASILRAVFDDAPTARLVLRAGRGVDGVVDGMLRRVDEVVLARMEAEIRAAKDAGVLRNVDERVVARFFLGGIEKLVLSYLDEDRPIDVDAIAREAARLELFGTYRRKDAP